MGRKKRKKRARAASAPAKAPKKAPPRQKREREAAPGPVSPDASRKRNFWTVVGSIGLLFLLGYGAILHYRIVDHDGGLYLAAYYLIKNGQTPYLDFFWPQFPVLVYFSAFWSHIAGSSPLSLRILSFLLTAGTFCLLAWWCWLKRFSAVITAAVLILWAANGLSADWLVAIKSYPLTVFLSVASFVCLSLAITKVSFRPLFLFLAGLMLGLAMGARLFYVVCGPPALLWAFLAVHKESGRWREAVRAVVWISAGLAVGMLPVLYFLTLDFEVFWFNCVTYHALRNTTSSFVADWPQKLRVGARLWPEGALAFMAAFSLILRYKETRKKYDDLWLAFAWAAVLGAMSFMTTPTWQQYFVTLVPFLVIGATPALSLLFSPSWQRFNTRIFAGLVAVCVVVGYAGEWRGDTTRHIARGIMPSRFDASKYLSLQAWNTTSKALENLTEPDDFIFSLWPGFPAAANRKIVPRLENNSINLIADKIDPEQSEKFFMADGDYVRDVLLEGVAKVVVTETMFFPGSPRRLSPFLTERYRSVATVDGVTIHVLQSNSTMPVLTPPIGRGEGMPGAG